MKFLARLGLLMAAISMPLWAHAASTMNLEQIGAQLEALTQRVSKLEQMNVQLSSDNQTLKAENAELKTWGEAWRLSTTEMRKTALDQTASTDKGKVPDWVNRFAFKGDLRYRFEELQDNTPGPNNGPKTADRERQRIRARFGVDAKATDNVTVGLQLTTTERIGTEDNGDPRGANQTLGNEFSRKRFNLDLAYFDWKFAPNLSLTGGKMRYPFVRPGQSQFFDVDVNPEGLALNYSKGNWFGTAYVFSVNEVSGPVNTATSDTYMTGGQIGGRFPIGSSNVLAAVQYYDFSSAKGRMPFYGGNPNGNTVLANGTLANDFNIVELLAEYNTKLGALPFQLWANLAENQDPNNFNDALGLGALLGKAADPRTWEASLFYQYIEKDSLFGQLFDSDFGGGVTGSKGYVFKGGYALAKNYVLNGTYYLTHRNINGPGRENDHNRFQIDLNVKF